MSFDFWLGVGWASVFWFIALVVIGELVTRFAMRGPK